MEDNPADITLVRELIQDHGMRCCLDVISDGEKALARVDEVASGGVPAPDLVLLDLHLPKRSGLDILRHIKESTDWNRIPVVVLSSSGAEVDKTAAMSLGATRYLQKPHTLDGYARVVGVLSELLTGDNRTQH